MPPEALQTETGECTELGRLYIPPWIFVAALRVLCTAVGQWNDSIEAEKLALDIIVVAHHPSVGLLHFLSFFLLHLTFCIVFTYHSFCVFCEVCVYVRTHHISMRFLEPMIRLFSIPQNLSRYDTIQFDIM